MIFLRLLYAADDDGAESEEKVEIVVPAAGAGTEAAADDSSSSSDGDADDGQDESQYRITVPLDMRLDATPPPPIFATSMTAMPHDSRVMPGVPPSAATLAMPLLATAVRPLMSVASRPVDLMSLPLAAHPPPSLHIADHPLPSLHHSQQLMLPVSTPAPLIVQPRCRDYDGESLSRLFIYPRL